MTNFLCLPIKLVFAPIMMNSNYYIGSNQLKKFVILIISKKPRNKELYNVTEKKETAKFRVYTHGGIVIQKWQYHVKQ